MAKIDTSGSPLSQADLRLINQSLYKATEAVQWIDKAELAGVPMEPERLMQQDVVTRLQAIKSTYFPGDQ